MNNKIFPLTKIIFGIGSNIENREQNINNAVSKLIDNLELKNYKKSKFYANKAMLPKNSPSSWDLEFLNIAFSGLIDINKFEPLNILKIIKKIETEIGRIESARWSPRVIDIDIILIDNLYFKNDELTIPHIGLFERDFFYKTAIEIEHDLIKKYEFFSKNNI